jgi:hypothetical protein
MAVAGILAQRSSAEAAATQLLTTAFVQLCALTRAKALAAQARRWQVGQKKVERWDCTMRRTTEPQRRQGWLSRP